MAETIPHWLSKRAQLTPEQIAVELPDGTVLTCKELEEKSKRFARKLASIGIKEGSHVGIISENNKSMAIAIHALSYLGSVAVLLNIRLTDKELNFQINDAKISHILMSDTFEADTNGMHFSVSARTFTDIENCTEQQVPLKTEINLDDIFTIIYTSGTTGFPKGVMHTYGNHWWSAVASVLNLGIATTDKWLAALPIFHVSGLSILIRSTIYGIPVYLLEKFDEKVVQEAIMAKGVTIVSVVTVMLKRLVDIIGDQHYPEAFRCMLLGGGPAPEPLLVKAKKHHIPVFQTYGMTETSSQIVTLSPKDALAKTGSAGKPLFPAQLKIDQKNENGIGEIFVKGPMVTSGYFNRDEATRAAFQNGWLATGDLGLMDEEGFLYVVDRRKDLIISGGENIYPSEIESVLSGMDRIMEVGVVGVDDETWGQVPAVFVVSQDDTVTVRDIIDYATRHLAAYKLPKQIYFVDHLPRNASNKLKRNKLAEWASKKK